MSTLLVGSDGSATFPDGYGAKLNTFSATLTRATTVVTGFGDVMARRRASGVLDITGSAGGTPIADASGANPLGIAGGGISTDGSEAIAITLTFRTASTACSLGFGAVVNSTAFSVTQDGAQTVTFNFEAEDSDGPTISWDES